MGCTNLTRTGAPPVGKHHQRGPGKVPRVCWEDVFAEAVRLVDDCISGVGVDRGHHLAVAAVQPQCGAGNGLLENAPGVVPQIKNWGGESGSSMQGTLWEEPY